VLVAGDREPVLMRVSMCPQTEVVVEHPEAVVLIDPGRMAWVADVLSVRRCSRRDV